MSYLDRWSEIGNYGQGFEAYVYWSSQFEDKFMDNWRNFWNSVDEVRKREE